MRSLIGTARGSNPGPPDPKSDALTTTPPPPLIGIGMDGLSIGTNISDLEWHYGPWCIKMAEARLILSVTEI